TATVTTGSATASPTGTPTASGTPNTPTPTATTSMSSATPTTTGGTRTPTTSTTPTSAVSPTIRPLLALAAVAPGNPIVYTLAYTNTGPVAATNVVITDAFCPCV